MNKSLETTALPENGKSDVETTKLYNISKKTVDYFHLGQYRYTDIKDAIAQSKRIQRASQSTG